MDVEFPTQIKMVAYVDELWGCVGWKTNIN